MFRDLFSPFQLKNCHFRNRIVMPGLASFLIEEDGSVTDRTVEHYRNRASGGTAMVIMEACAVSPEGRVSNHQPRIYDDRFVEGLSRIAQILKKEGAVPALQLHHAGRQTSQRVIGRRPLAPSALSCPVISGEVESLSIAGIQDLIGKFGEAAARAVQAGFQVIEIHGAHGYLVNQFLSRYSNDRNDEYGGDLSGRTRFAREVVAEVRNRVGKDIPISFKISAQEFVRDGLTVGESTEILRELVEAGIDIVQVSAGTDATPEWISQPMFMEKACLAGSAERIRKALDIPVMAVGRINDPVVADALIGQGKADLVCIGRGLLADPEFPRKAAEGRTDEIRTCIACNTCMQSIYRKGRIECMVNPTLGREKEMKIQPADVSRNIMVVGGGPGGLDAAWVAAKRGHEVHLYEKRSQLGGQLTLCSCMKCKQEILNLIRYQKAQILKYGVHTHLNTQVTLDLIKEQDPDVIILATGSVPIKPALPGLDKEIVLSLPQILNGQGIGVKKTVIIGGGASGCELAHHLALNGCHVTLVEQQEKIAAEVESVTRRVLIRELQKYGVEIITGLRLSRVEDHGVWAVAGDGKELFMDAERVVLTVGNRPENRLFEAIKSLGKPVHQIGDSLEPRTAKTAIAEGALIGRRI